MVVSVGVGAHLAMKNKSVADSMNSAVDCADNVAVAEAQNESAKAYESSVMYGAPNKSSLSGSKVDETESVPEIEAEFRVETESEEYIIFHDSQNTTEEKELTTPSYKSAANESDKPEGEQSAPLVFDGITADTQEEIDDYAYAVTEAQTTDSNVFSQNETLIGVDDVKSSQEETAKAKETAKEDSDEKTAENEEVVLTGIPSSTDVTSVSESKTTGAGIYEIKGEGDCNSVSLKVVLPVFAFTVLLLIVILLLVRLVNLKKNNND